MDNLTTFDGAMKELYDSQTVQKMTYKGRPFLNWVPKRENFFGRNHPVPVMYAAPNGASADFATAQANQQPASIVEFLVTRVRDYQLATIQNELIEAADGDVGSFMDAAGPLVNAAIDNAGRRVSSALFRDTTGALARMSATSGVTTTITLLNVEDIVLFEVGQTLVASTLATGASIKAGSLLVTGIDRDAGTLTVSPSGATLVAVLAVSDYLYVAGDPTRKMAGLASWIPTSAPAATSYFGVDRTVDTQRLGGVRHTASGAPVKEALIDLSIKIARAGGDPDAAFLNPTDWGNLDKSLEASVVRSEVKSEAGFSFRAIELMTPNGVVKVMADRDCLVGVGWMLQQDTWTFKTLRGAPRVLERDGRFLRVQNADAYEVRIGWYGNLECNAPGRNGVVTF